MKEIKQSSTISQQNQITTVNGKNLGKTFPEALIDTLMHFKGNVIIFHHTDMDGIFSEVLMKYICETNSDVNISLVSYNYEKNMDFSKYFVPDSRTIAISVDLSLKVKQIMTLASISYRFFLIDHHITTLNFFAYQNELGTYDRMTMDLIMKKDEKGEFFFFISTESCATKIIYTLFASLWKDVNPRVIELCDWYDTWKHPHEPNGEDAVYLNTYMWQSNQLNSISSLPFNIITASDKDLNSVIESGEILASVETTINKLKAAMFGEVVKIKFIGKEYICYRLWGRGNSLSFGSAINKYDICIMQSINYQGDLAVSLYTAKSDIDVSKIAQSFGGGGHKKAAGYIVPKKSDQLFKGGSK